MNEQASLTKTDQEIRQLALDLQGGRIFSHTQIPESMDVSMVFMILAMMDEEAQKKFEEAEPGFIYEYMSQAAPRSINGLPCFFSIRYLSKEDSQRLRAEVEKLEKFVETGETDAD